MGDFERIFGAGANQNSIIEGFSYTPPTEAFDTRQIEFARFQDAQEFCKSYPGSILRPSGGEMLRGEPSFIVASSKSEEFFRIGEYFGEEISYRAKPENFVIFVPSNYQHPKAELWCDPLQDLAEDGVSFQSVFRYCTGNSGGASFGIHRKPFSLEVIEKNLAKLDLALVYVNESFSLLVLSDENFSMNGAIFTECNCSHVIHWITDSAYLKKLYAAFS